MRYLRDDATRWVWIIYGLTQATVTMLMAFDVLDATGKLPQGITAVALVLYVAVNELLVKPKRLASKPATQDADVDAGNGEQQQPPC